MYCISFSRYLKKAVLLPCLLLWGIHTTLSQVFNIEDQTVYVGPDVILSIKGDILNNGTLENQGEIVITGNWDNKRQYLAHEGTIVLSGENQIFNHNGGDIYELVIEGGGEKQFISDAAISGRLLLEEGIVTPSSEVKLLAKSSASVSEGYAGSYINGTFYHQGAGEKVFPIGTNGHYNPVTLQLNGNPIVGFGVFEPNEDPYFSLELRAVSTMKYWEQHLVSGHIGEGSSITLPMSIEHDEATVEEIVIAAASLEEGTYKPLQTQHQTGFVNSGFITSKLTAEKQIFALGLTAERPEERALFVPNAFAPLSPKANSEDNRIKVYGKEISNEGFMFRIYNRWGELVYESFSYEEASTVGWDGINRNTGRAELMGSYKYILKGKFNSGRTIEKTGNIHLIR